MGLTVAVGRVGVGPLGRETPGKAGGAIGFAGAARGGAFNLPFTPTVVQAPPEAGRGGDYKQFFSGQVYTTTRNFINTP